jgi:glycosyltransferase involved in cell wall biosynthesis
MAFPIMSKKEDMKVLILLAYFERPNLIKVALDSIKRQSYDNWEVAFCDDGTKHFGKPIVEKMFSKKDLNKFKFYATGDSPEQKKKQGGSRHGEMLNTAMQESNADVAFILCDDDALYKDYLKNLVNFYKENSNSIYSYGKVSIYNPNNFISFETLEDNFNNVLNHREGPISPAYTVDASQVSWRLDNFKEAGIKFLSPQTAALDANLYQQLERAFGKCDANECVAQYKGLYPQQLGNRKDPYNSEDSL